MGSRCPNARDGSKANSAWILRQNIFESAEVFAPGGMCLFLHFLQAWNTLLILAGTILSGVQRKSSWWQAVEGDMRNLFERPGWKWNPFGYWTTKYTAGRRVTRVCFCTFPTGFSHLFCTFRVVCPSSCHSLAAALVSSGPPLCSSLASLDSMRCAVYLRRQRTLSGGPAVTRRQDFEQEMRHLEAYNSSYSKYCTSKYPFISISYPLTMLTDAHWHLTFGYGQCTVSHKSFICGSKYRDLRAEQTAGTEPSLAPCHWHSSARWALLQPLA